LHFFYQQLRPAGKEWQFTLKKQLVSGAVMLKNEVRVDREPIYTVPRSSFCFKGRHCHAEE
jgi:hypothetical protein